MAKRQHLTPDDEIGRLLEHRLQHATAPSAEVCADAETLASYVDDGMSAAERAEWEAHFATCAKCRRALALMARLKETASPEWEGEASRDNPSPGGNLWVWMPLAACILVGAGLYFATRPAEPTYNAATSASGAAAGAASGPAAVTQQAREESPRAPAPEPLTPPPPPPASAPAASQPSTSASPASAVPQRQLADRKDDALREKRAVAEPVTAKVRRESAAAEAEAGRATGDLSAGAAPATVAPAATVAAPPATPPPAVAEQYAAGGRAFQGQQAPAQKAQMASGPREQQQAARAGGTVGGKVGSIDAVNARPSGPTNAANANVANAPAPAQQEKTPEPAAAAAPVPTFRTETRTGAEDKLALKRAAANERDGDLAAQRAAGLLVMVADPAHAERRWRVFKFGRIEVTRDGGGSWSNDVLRLDTTFTATATPAPGICWIVGSKGTVWHLAPGDGTWQERRAPTDEDLVSVTATSGQDAVVVTRSSQRFATSDSGKTWKRQ